MSIDGTFNVSVTSPLGTEKFELILHAEGESLAGSVSAHNATEPITGVVRGQEAEFIRKVKTPMGAIEATLKITVAGDKVSGKVHTAFGAFPLEGTRA